MLSKTPKTSLIQLVYERLRADILASRLPPAERLKVNVLCAQLCVSPGAVREALSRLTAEGFIVAAPQHGFSVTPISIDELRDLTIVRIQIEEFCLRRAIAQGDLTWEARIVAAFHQLSQTPMRMTSDPDQLNEDWVHFHADFHAALIAGCGSPWLLRLHEQLYAQSERYRRLSVPLDSSGRDVLAEHSELAAVVLARNVERAVTLMSQHLKTTMSIVADGIAKLGKPLAVESSPAISERRVANDTAS